MGIDRAADSLEVAHEMVPSMGFLLGEWFQMKKEIYIQKRIGFNKKHTTVIIYSCHLDVTAFSSAFMYIAMLCYQEVGALLFGKSVATPP